MSSSNKFILPGGSKQFRILKQRVEIKNKNILIVGESSERIAMKFASDGCQTVEIIVRDYEALMQSRISLDNTFNISVRINDFERTDFPDNQFDIVYSQASLSNSNRKNVIKEIKRILKPEGIFCVSEITKLKNDIPAFVKNIFDSSQMNPLNHSEFKEYFLSKGFSLIFEQDLSSSLKDFYENIKEKLVEYQKNASETERAYYKKLLNKISHESNAYLKLGGSKYIGLNFLILKNNK
jgi:ubiquinone/menaquinone biosynthesis C-methylase UbiE